MDNTTLTQIAAIVATLNELNSGTPESQLYILCNMNMEQYQRVRSVLVKANYAKISGHFVTLTEDGKAFARKIESVLAENRASKN